MTEEEIEAAARSDPHAQPLTSEELAQFFRPGAIRDARERLGLTQQAFAKRFCLDLRALRAWEDGRAVPESMARAYLRVIERNPQAVLDHPQRCLCPLHLRSDPHRFGFEVP